ncbi:MAG TPA: hypothetical protein DCM67_00155, partial [Propionibacteriaceae bacterium]|nr:hypothetical protein [Propionibacteriaceae bacterium]
MAREGRLANRIAIVTGGGRGLGKAIALAYAEEGADLVLVGRGQEELNRAAEEIQALGRKALAISADVTQIDHVKSMVQATLSEFGKIDILMNAAGQRAVFPTTELTFEDWQRVLNVNLTGSFVCSQVVGKEMIERGYGKIIMMGSMQAHSGAPERAAYIASKTGLVGLTRALGVEWAKYGVNVNILSPGYFRTDIIEHQIKIGQLNLEA